MGEAPHRLKCTILSLLLDTVHNNHTGPNACLNRTDCTSVLQVERQKSIENSSCDVLWRTRESISVEKCTFKSLRLGTVQSCYVGPNVFLIRDDCMSVLQVETQKSVENSSRCIRSDMFCRADEQPKFDFDSGVKIFSLSQSDPTDDSSRGSRRLRPLHTPARLRVLYCTAPYCTLTRPAPGTVHSGWNQRARHACMRSRHPCIPARLPRPRPAQSGRIAHDCPEI